jgi:hypothetical protein
MVERV